MFTIFKLCFVVFSPHVQPVHFDVALNFALGVLPWIGGHAASLGTSLRLGLLIFLTIFGLRQLLRYDALAVVTAALLFTMTQGDVNSSSEWMILAALYVVIYSALAFVLLRCGLVATVAAVFFANSGNAVLLGWDWKTWYAPSGIASFLLLLAIALWAFWRSLGGRELLGDDQ
jgi:hypothetical protein